MLWVTLVFVELKLNCSRCSTRQNSVCFQRQHWFQKYTQHNCKCLSAARCIAEHVDSVYRQYKVSRIDELAIFVVASNVHSEVVRDASLDSVVFAVGGNADFVVKRCSKRLDSSLTLARCQCRRRLRGCSSCAAAHLHRRRAWIPESDSRLDVWARHESCIRTCSRGSDSVQDHDLCIWTPTGCVYRCS